MLAVVCDDHKEGLEQRLLILQDNGQVPAGKIHFQPLKTIVTDCVTGMKEDYVEIALKRDIDLERK